MDSLGEQPSNRAPVITISSGRYLAQIATYGGGIKSLTYDGRPLVETYPDDAFPPLNAGVVLAPWPNRTDAGAYDFQGQSYQLPITEPDRNNAIHGFVADIVWKVELIRPERVLLSTTIEPQQGWPWAIELAADYLLTDSGLRAQFTATTPHEAVPFGFGWHTYLSAQGAEVDKTTLRVGVDKQWMLDDRNLPTGELVQPTNDVSGGLPMAGKLLDDCFLAERTPVTTVLESQGVGVSMHCSEQFPWFQIFTPDPAWEMPYPGRGRSVAVEPMTTSPNGLNLGIDTIGAASPWHGTITISAYNKHS